MKIKILATLALAYVLSYALRTIGAVMSPVLISEMKLTDGQLGLLSATYFITFALMQLPLGPLLDKYGTRKVESVLLVIAGLGALIFALSPNFWGLFIGRLLIGAGVSACLMGAFKVFREHFALNTQGVLAMFMLFFGTLGALLATTPSQIILENYGWRVIFIGISIFLFLSAILVFSQIPEIEKNENKSSFKISLSAYIPVLKAPIFWQSFPIFFIMVGSFLSMQSLWCGPWLVEVAKMTNAQAAQGLMYMTFSQLLAYIIIGGLLAPIVEKKGQLFNFVKISYILAIIALIGALSFPQSWGLIGFMLFFFFYASNTLSYTIVNIEFPKEMVARSSTASNFVLMIGAFFFQWLIGAYISARIGYLNFGISPNRAEVIAEALIINAVLMLFSIVWYIGAGKKISNQIAQYFQKKFSGDIG